MVIGYLISEVSIYKAWRFIYVALYTVCILMHTYRIRQEVGMSRYPVLVRAEEILISSLGKINNRISRLISIHFVTGAQY